MICSKPVWMKVNIILLCFFFKAHIGSAQSNSRPLQSILEPSQSLTKQPLSQTTEPLELPTAGIGPNQGLRLEPADPSSNAELIRQRSASGAIHVERWVAEDSQGNLVDHGSYVAYDTKGGRALTGSYNWGKREGEWRKRISLEQVKQLSATFDKGFEAPFISTASFKDGVLHGEWTVIDAHERKVLTWRFESGKRNGVSEFFDSSGNTVQSITYIDNLVDGPAHLTSNERSEQFSRGKAMRLVETWYPTAATPITEQGSGIATRQLKSQEWVLEPSALNIAMSDWDACRVEYQKPDVGKPVRHGRSVTLHRNGQMESEGSYDSGKRHGAFTWWYANGQPKTEGEYCVDKECSQWIWWHENGMKEANGSYANGTKVGEWSFWKPDGKLVSRVTETGSRVADRVEPHATSR